MEAPKRATKFAANDSWGEFYKKAFGVQKMTQQLSVLTGATAGATEAFVVVPFELVKIRLQDKAQAGRYSGAADALIKIVQQEGPLALYNGLEATLWRYLLCPPFLLYVLIIIQAYLVECWVFWMYSFRPCPLAKSHYQARRTRE